MFLISSDFHYLLPSNAPRNRKSMNSLFRDARGVYGSRHLIAVLTVKTTDDVLLNIPVSGKGTDDPVMVYLIVHDSERVTNLTSRVVQFRNSGKGDGHCPVESLRNVAKLIVKVPLRGDRFLVRPFTVPD